MRDDNKTKELLDTLDYDYAYEKRYRDTEIESERVKKAEDYVERNSGLKKRRADNYDMYKNGTR